MRIIWLCSTDTVIVLKTTFTLFWKGITQSYRPKISMVDLSQHFETRFSLAILWNSLLILNYFIKKETNNTKEAQIYLL